jgi:hypothetical protein
VIGDQLLLFIVYQKSCQIHAHAQCFSCSSFFEIIPIFKFSDQMSMSHKASPAKATYLRPAVLNRAGWLHAQPTKYLTVYVWIRHPIYPCLVRVTRVQLSLGGNVLLLASFSPLSAASTLVLRQCEHIADHNIKRIQNVNSSIWSSPNALFWGLALS